MHRFKKKINILTIGLLLFSISSLAQVGKEFKPRFPKKSVRGDLVLIGNTVLAPTRSNPTGFDVSYLPSTKFPPEPSNLATLTEQANLSTVYSNQIDGPWKEDQNGDGKAGKNKASYEGTNNHKNMEYIDIDNDPTTFSSSSARLSLVEGCKKIVYAGLYWTAIYTNERINLFKNYQGSRRHEDFDNIKFKTPTSGNYVSITADEIIFDGKPTDFRNHPYLCYADVTDIVNNVPNPQDISQLIGDYTVANVRATRGRRLLGSISGWTLVVIYEDTKMSSKQLSTYDGFVNVESSIVKVELKIDGFSTPKTGPVVATVGIMSQEGELYTSDYLNVSRKSGVDGSSPTLLLPNGKIDFTKHLFNSKNPENNVFNSTITIPDPNPLSGITDAIDVVTRNPSRLNTFGFDLDMIRVNDGVLKNNQTEIDLQLTTNGDAYAIALVTMAIDIVSPFIELKQEVFDDTNVDLNLQEIDLGAEMTYKISYKNTGDDIATDLIIENKIPEFVDLDLSSIAMPTGMTYTFDSNLRQITFTRNAEIAIDAEEFLSFKVKLRTCVDPDNYLKSKQCGIELTNTIQFKYSGKINPETFEGTATRETSTCTQESNILVSHLKNIVLCDKTSTYPICNFETEISALDGFQTYTWKKLGSNTIIHIGQTLLLQDEDDLGTYEVMCQAFENPDSSLGQVCASLRHIITVTELELGQQDPFVGLTFDIESCSPGIKIPKFYLCDSPTKKVTVKIPEGVSKLFWEKSSCSLSTTGSNCSAENGSCTWSLYPSTIDGDTSTILATSGSYRIVYEFNNEATCIDREYFNVYSAFIPTYTSEDIYCERLGYIDINIPGSDDEYEFSLNGIEYETYPGKRIPISTAGTYTVYIRPVIATSANCPPFRLSNIKITNRKMSVRYNVNQVSCFGYSDALIEITASGARTGVHYEFILKKGLTQISSGTNASGRITLEDLNAGNYTLSVFNNDGCQFTEEFTITEPEGFFAVAQVTKGVTCTEPQITITTRGGARPYTVFYEVHDTFGDLLDFENRSLEDTIVSQIIFDIPLYDKTVKVTVSITDASNCDIIELGDFIFNPITDLTLDLIEQKNVTCNGSSTGSLKVNARGSLGSYRYSILDSEGTNLGSPPITSSPALFSNLAAGYYTIVVDSGDCTADYQFEITEPPLIEPSFTFDDVTCHGFANVTLNVTATGGSGDFQYSISTLPGRFFDVGQFRGLKAGDYEITVRDSNNCSITKPLSIVDPEPLQAEVVESSIIQELCIGGKSGQFTIKIEGGTAPYRTSLNSVTGPFLEDQLTFTNLSGGKHVVYIKDAYQCELSITVDLTLPVVKLMPHAEVSYNCADNSAANSVTVRIDASNIDSSKITYALDGTGPYQSSPKFTNINSGKHYIRVQHVDGCVQDTNEFIIDEPNTPLSITLELGNLNQINFNITGGSGYYNKVRINDEESSFIDKYTYYSTGTYTVTVTDTNGCTATDSKPFEFIGLDVPNIFTPNGNGKNDGWKPKHQEIYPDIIVKIYDRYGRELATLRQDEEWDGKYEGKEMPTGDYWYVIKLLNKMDSREFVGNFTLYR